MNVETYDADTTAMCSVLPWNIERFSVPGIPAKGANFTAVPYAGLSCPNGQYANFSF